MGNLLDVCPRMITPPLVAPALDGERRTCLRPREIHAGFAPLNFGGNHWSPRCGQRGWGKYPPPKPVALMSAPLTAACRGLVNPPNVDAHNRAQCGLCSV